MNGIFTHRIFVRTVLTALVVIFAIATVQAQGPKASFTQDKTKGCLPLIVQFTNTSTGTGLSYFWDFGNGNTSAVQSPGAIYNTAGNYTIKLVVTDANGKTDSTIQPFAVKAFGSPDAAFTADLRKGCTGQQFSFTDSSTVASAPINSWQWNFGDGNASLDKNPKHIFATDGVFSVSLIITDTNGCKNFINKAGFIKTTLAAQINFTADNTGGCSLPLNVKFSNKTPLQQGLTYTYAWAFGNGDSSNQKNPSFTYTKSGNYEVALTMKDNNNCVSNLSVPKFISLGKTTADFTVDSKRGCAPHTVNFTNTGTAIPSDAIVKWFFGNGDSAIGDTPRYTYQQAGTYSVTMVVSSPSGCNDILVKTNEITVLALPQALFAHGATVSCSVPFTINFSSVNPTATTFKWYFGDGDSSVFKNPVKVYKKAGLYDVSLTIMDINGCYGTFVKSKLVRVHTQHADFTPSVDRGCVPVSVNFTNNSNSYYTITNYDWDLGNGKTATTKTAQVTYNQPGVYYPRLIITDNNGCKDTLRYDSIRVGTKTHPDFVADKTYGCKMNMKNVNFTNLTDTKKQKIDTYAWDFGLLTSTLKDPIIDYYQYPNTYTVRLITVSNGCADTMVKKDYITILMPDAKQIVKEDPCKLDTIHVEDGSKGGHVFEWTLDRIVISHAKKFDLFLNPGTYELDLHIKDTITGCEDSKSYIFNIHTPLNPGFTTSADSSCTNIPVLLQDTTTGSLLSEWLVTAHDTITGKIAKPEFSNPGWAQIKLITTDQYGCKESITKNQTLKIIGPDFTPHITPDKGCFPLDAKLIKTGSSVYGVAKAKWFDNQSETDGMPDTVNFSLKSFEPEMNTTGEKVYLMVTDNLGCQVTRSVTVKLSKPVAAIASVPNYFCDHTTLDINHNITSSFHIDTLQYRWFMDGQQVSTGSKFSPDFYGKSNPEIKLIVVENGLGCADSLEINIPVSLKKLKAAYTVDKSQSTCPPLLSTFTDASVLENTSIAKVKWGFGDTSSSIVSTPEKTYFYPGNYNVTYTITDAQGCSDSVTIPGQITIGGPQGTYFIDKYKGCVPFEANFSAQTQNATKINWDLGNGQLNTGANAKGLYSLPGSYRPSLVLEDASGCLVIYPVKDPIVGYATPTPDFAMTGKCANEDFAFTNTTDTTKIQCEFKWDFDGAKMQTGYHAFQKFGKSGQFNISLQATATNGCVAIKTATVEIKPLVVDFDTKQTKACRFSGIQLTNKVNAGAGVKSYSWLSGDGGVYNTANPTITYKTPGRYPISLYVEDNNGCKDSLIDYKEIAVFDTVAPVSPDIYRVTVAPDNSTRLEFKPYRDDDFTHYHIFRSTLGQPFALVKKADCQTDTVYVDKGVNTFGQTYSYKVQTLNLCGKSVDNSTSNVHTSILLQTVIDTNVVTVKWNAYDGWAVRTYQLYRKGPADADYKWLATLAPTQTSYMDDKVFCGNKYDYVVYAEKDSKQDISSSSNLTGAKPIYKPEVYPARMVRATVEDDKNILIEFAPNNKQKTPIDYFTVQKSVDGVNYTQVYKTTTFGWHYTDEQVAVHSQSYYYTVQTTDICGAVSVPSDIGKSILLSAKADADDNVQVNWSQYQNWEEGILSYELEQMDASGNYNRAATNNAGDTTYYDQGNFNNLLSLCYRVKATSNTGVISYSNTGCVKGRSSLFVPNAFTPNNDEHNNVFTVVGAYIKKYELNIYNRYGEKVFTSYSLDDSWDGTYKGQPAQDGAYMYVITSLGIDNQHHNVSGTVTLLR